VSEELKAVAAELRQKYAATTQGEWRVGTDERVWADVDDQERGICCQSEFGQEQANWIADAEFIATAHKHVPGILDALERQGTELKRISEDEDYLFRADVGNDWEERLQVQAREIERLRAALAASDERVKVFSEALAEAEKRAVLK
jgi:hypothetical protein